MSWTWNIAAPADDQAFSVNVGMRRISVCWVVSEKMTKEWKFPIWVPGKISACRMENSAKMFELFPPTMVFPPPTMVVLRYSALLTKCFILHQHSQYMEVFDAFMFFPFFFAFLFCCIFVFVFVITIFFFHLYVFFSYTNSWVFLSQKIQHKYHHTSVKAPGDRMFWDRNPKLSSYSLFMFLHCPSVVLPSRGGWEPITLREWVSRCCTIHIKLPSVCYTGLETQLLSEPLYDS